MNGFLGVPVSGLIGLALAAYGAWTLGRRVAGWIARAAGRGGLAPRWEIYSRANGSLGYRREVRP